MRNQVRLKLNLAIKGIRLSPQLESEGWLTPTIEARNYASRNLEIILPEEITVRCPVGTHTARASPYERTVVDDDFVLA